MRLVEVRESSLGGLGLFALRDFVPGDMALSEKAFLTAKGAEWEGEDASRSEKSGSSKLIAKAVKALPPDAAALFWGFGQSAQFGETPTAHGIFWTNYIDADPDADNEFACMFQHICRLNHSCPPHHNVKWAFDSKTAQMSCSAVRDIKAGEELRVDYFFPDTESPLPRKEYLETFYGFSCVCGGACVGPASEGV